MSPLNLYQLFQHIVLSHSIMTFALFALSLFLPLILFFFRPTIPKKKLKLPPSPMKLPILGNLHQLGSLPHRSLASFSKKYGPIMLLRLGQKQTLVVSSPELAREVMKEQDLKFSTRPFLTIPSELLYNGKDIAFAPYGEYWRQVKKISHLHLLNTRRVLSFRHIREEEVASMIEKVNNLSALGPVNVTMILNSLAKDFISRVALGKCSSRESWSDVIGDLITEASSLLATFHWGDYVPWLAWVSAATGLDARVRRAFELGNELLESIVEERRIVFENGEREGSVFVDILLSLEKDLNSSFPLDNDNIKAIVQDMFGAAIDSTYIVMEWVMAELVQNPEAMRKLKLEIRGIVGSRTVVNEADLMKMDYLKAIIKEALRLHPPGPLLVPRELMEETEIQGYHVPKHTRVAVNVWAIGRDPNVWELPEKFQPERFIGDNPVDFVGQDFQLTPFGAGRRMCPGIQFAVSVIELAVANLMHQFDWKLPNNMREEDLDMMEDYGLTCRKKIKLLLVASPCYNQ